MNAKMKRFMEETSRPGGSAVFVPQQFAWICACFLRRLSMSAGKPAAPTSW
jgi:hypothetical protein